MRSKLVVLFFLLFIIKVFPQWQNVWTSSNISSNAVSGWVLFDKDGDNWKSRLYTIDTIDMKIMEPGFSSTVNYTYTFNNAEKLLGEQIYSLGVDLNGNNTADFYVLSGYGSATNYRQSFKIFDFSTGATIFEKNEPGFFYSYPSVSDLDLDGKMECIVIKYPWPSAATYTYEIYKTNITSAPDGSIHAPVEFKLMQNYPNPFNPSTKINYSLSNQSSVKLRIFDIKGATIKTLVEDNKSAGEYEVEWNGNNDAGSKQPTGIYFYELIVNGKKQVNKMLLLK